MTAVIVSGVLNEFWKAVVGPITGAGVAVVGIWIKDRLDRRRQLQEWYEQTCVIATTDPVILQLKRWFNEVISPSQFPFRLDVDLATLPYVELHRIYTMLGDDTAEQLFIGLAHTLQLVNQNDPSSEVVHKVLVNRLATIVGNQSQLFKTIQTVLLSVHINRKAKIFELGRRKNVRKLVAWIQQHETEFSPHNLFREILQELTEEEKVALAEEIDSLEQKVEMGLTEREPKRISPYLL